MFVSNVPHIIVQHFKSKKNFKFSCPLEPAKGQFISEGNFDVFKSPKKRTKYFEGFLSYPLKWVKTKKIMAHYHAN